MTNPPLKGIRVLDFGRYIAGPYCAALLAEYGADVIRIEKRDGSEDRWNTPVAEGGEGALFLQMNRNKRSLTLDPMTPGGREVIDRLVATADVVVANLPTQTLARMGLDYERLSTLNPRIILTTVSAYGPSGPMSRNVGFDGVGQVMSGAVYLTGTPEQPYRAMVPWVDFGTALHCAFCTMVALKERESSGKGQIVRGTLLGTALTYGNALLIEQAVLGVNRIATGNRGQTSAPNDLFRTRDGWVICQVIGQPLYARWAKLMGEPEWLSDPRFHDDRARGDNGTAISARMARWCAERGSEEVITILGEAMIPCGPLLAPQETLDHPQVAALGLLQALDYPGLPKPAPVGRVPVELSRTDPVARRPPPVLGADSAAILGELGYAAQAVEKLRADGVI
jgi:crotonobetainyl-CoA:carnitine CoA-transferase CaiB-like acyl-CoA transferase